eukprot:UN1538
MSSCTGIGLWQAILALLASPQSRAEVEAVWDLHCYNTAIFTCIGSDAWRLCMSLFDGMVSNTVEPDAVTYRWLARSCGYGRQWQVALGILADFQQRRLPDPDHSVWQAVAWACDVAGRGPPAKASPVASHICAVPDFVTPSASWRRREGLLASPVQVPT